MMISKKRATLALAILVGLILPAGGCKKKTPKTTPTVTSTPTPPDPTPPPTPIRPDNDDFVVEKPSPDVRTETLPSDLGEVNRMAQTRGWIKDVFFTYDESTLSSSAQEGLSASADWLRKNSKYDLLIEGHCDERGTEEYNLALGDRRANIVKDYLSTLGVDSSRIRTVSYGEERPFERGTTENAYAQNRRAHLVVVGK